MVSVTPLSVRDAGRPMQTPDSATEIGGPFVSFAIAWRYESVLAAADESRVFVVARRRGDEAWVQQRRRRLPSR